MNKPEPTGNPEIHDYATISGDNGKTIEVEFKPEYLQAFLALLLLKAGGKQTITVDLLKRFPPNECPQLSLSDDGKAFVMTSPKRGIVTPGRKLIIPN